MIIILLKENIYGMQILIKILIKKTELVIKNNKVRKI